MLLRIHKQWLAHFICAMLGTASIAGAWDVWWHMLRIRDTFWEPPHILLYSSIALAIIGSVYGGYYFREKVWVKLAAVFAIIPLAAPFDNLWHNVFGREVLTSPLVVWSPPHMMLIVGFMLGIFYLVRIIKRDKDIILHEFFGSLAFAIFAGSLFFVTAPLHPFENHHLLGFWGAGSITFAMVIGVLLAQREFPSPLSATYVMLYFTLFRLANFHESVNPKVIIQAHPHIPAWIFIFSFITPAIISDLMRYKSARARGVIFGFVYGFLFYFISLFFVGPEFIYSFNNLIQAIVSSMIGGFAAALVVRK